MLPRSVLQSSTVDIEENVPGYPRLFGLILSGLKSCVLAPEIMCVLTDEFTSIKSFQADSDIRTSIHS